MKAPQWTAPAPQPAPTLDAMASALAGIVGEQAPPRNDVNARPFIRAARAFRAMLEALEDDADAYNVPEMMGFTMALDMIQTIFAVRGDRGP